LLYYLDAACYYATAFNHTNVVDPCDASHGSTSPSRNVLINDTVYTYLEITLYGGFRYAVALPVFSPFTLYFNYPHRMATTFTLLHLETGYYYRR
jgi:hypothetical protein